MKHWTKIKARPPQLRSIVIDGKHKGENALLGVFKDDKGRDYFMVVNLWHDKNVSARAGAKTIMLKFTPDVTVVTRLSRETGIAEHLAVKDGILKLRLPGGTGDLFKLHGADFPGICP